VRASEHQDRRGRDRRAELLHQHDPEDTDQTIFRIERDGLFLGRALRPGDVTVAALCVS
jgi:hypothetical protein